MPKNTATTEALPARRKAIHAWWPAGNRTADSARPSGWMRHVVGEPCGPTGLLPVGHQPDHHAAAPVQVDPDDRAVVDLCVHQDLLTSQTRGNKRDAYVIADTARTMPHTLRSVDISDETSAELAMLVGFDDDLAGEATRISNRLRGLLTQIHPSLERVLGPRIQHKALLWLLERYGSPPRSEKPDAGNSSSVCARWRPG